MTLPYYPFYWGDYSAKTFNLTQGQHGAYLLLLRHVYTEGTPIPIEQCYTIAKALLPIERENVDYILANYFQKKAQGWVNHRAIQVMKEWQEKHQRRVIAGKKAKKQSSSNDPPMPKQPEPEPIKKEESNTHTLAGTVFPNDFSPDEQTVTRIQELGLSRRDVIHEIGRMRDWAANAGLKGIKRDWQAFARIWLTDFAQKSRKYKSHGKSGKPNGHSIQNGLTVFDQYLERFKREENDGAEIGVLTQDGGENVTVLS